MALIFASFLFSSLWQRFMHPDLVIHRMADHNHPENSMPDNMEFIGRLMQMVSKNPQDLEATLKLSESLMAMGQWQSAENFAQKAMSLASGNPDETRPLYLLSLIHHNAGKNEQAAELLEKILEKEDNPAARYNLGILYIHYLKQPQKGQEQFRKALAHKGLAASLKAAITEELDKITKALPEEDAAARAHPLEDPADARPEN